MLNNPYMESNKINKRVLFYSKLDKLRTNIDWNRGLVEFYHTSRFQRVISKRFQRYNEGFMKKRLGLWFDWDFIEVWFRLCEIRLVLIVRVWDWRFWVREGRLIERQRGRLTERALQLKEFEKKFSFVEWFWPLGEG